MLVGTGIDLWGRSRLLITQLSDFHWGAVAHVGKDCHLHDEIHRLVGAVPLVNMLQADVAIRCSFNLVRYKRHIVRY